MRLKAEQMEEKLRKLKQQIRMKTYVVDSRRLGQSLMFADNRIPVGGERKPN